MRFASLAGLVLGLGSVAGMSMPSGMLAEAPGLSQATQKSIEKNSHNPAKPKSNKLQAILGGGLGGWGGKQRRAGYGWTNMHAQRVARKKRNQAKHRASSRGRSRA
jgi:hypothetical protein